jgi:hypothetical protein
MITAVLSRNALRDGSSSVSARETQSMAFFSTPLIELLYSGAEIISPSCSRKSALSLRAFLREPALRLQIVIEKRHRKITKDR